MNKTLKFVNLFIKYELILYESYIYILLCFLYYKTYKTKNKKYIVKIIINQNKYKIFYIIFAKKRIFIPYIINYNIFYLCNTCHSFVFVYAKSIFTVIIHIIVMA